MKMKNKPKHTQEQIDAARQKRLSSSEFRGRVKKSIESLRTFNLTKAEKFRLSKREIKNLAIYFCERIDVSSLRVKEPSTLEAVLDDTAPKNSIKY